MSRIEMMSSPQSSLEPGAVGNASAGDMWHGKHRVTGKQESAEIETATGYCGKPNHGAYTYKKNSEPVCPKCAGEAAAAETAA